MKEIIIGLAMTFILYGMWMNVCELRERHKLKERLRRMRDRYYKLYENALTEYDREYFYSVYERCADELKGVKE